MNQVTDDNINKIKDIVKMWLLNQVGKQTHWKNFGILLTKDISINNNEILFNFLCSYQWQLNSWIKDVSKEIYIVFDIKKNKVVYCSEIVIEV